jgi:hypothetical protein
MTDASGMHQLDEDYRAPLLCTASMIFFQPATCKAEKMPGMRG